MIIVLLVPTVIVLLLSNHQDFRLPGIHEAAKTQSTSPETGTSLSDIPEEEANGNDELVWNPETQYIIRYHSDESSEASDMVSVVTYGVQTKTFTSDQLGFTSDNMIFRGWKVWRKDDDAWLTVMDNGNMAWVAETDEKTNFRIYSDGKTVDKTVLPGSEVHFFGVWVDSGSKVILYDSDTKVGEFLYTEDIGDTIRLPGLPDSYRKDGKTFLYYSLEKDSGGPE